MDDPRWACMIDADTVLISCTNEIQIRHRTKGLQKRIDGFASLTRVRYHPTLPWIIDDGGLSEVVIYDPKSKTRKSLSLRYRTNDPRTPASKWLVDGQLPPHG
jgi:hypothetical protein